MTPVGRSSRFSHLRLIALAPMLLLAHCAGTSASTTVDAPQPFVSPDISFDRAHVLATPAEQERMRQWSLSRLDRRYVRLTYESGPNTVDCIDFDKQPACIAGGCPHDPPVAPTPPRPPGGFANPPSSSASELPAPTDTRGCAQGTVGIVRADVEWMTHFRTLEDYLAMIESANRNKGGPGEPPRPPAGPPAAPSGAPVTAGPTAGPPPPPPPDPTPDEVCPSDAAAAIGLACSKRAQECLYPEKAGWRIACRGGKWEPKPPPTPPPCCKR